MSAHLEKVDAFMKEFDAAMQAACMLPGSVSDAALDPRIIVGTWSRKRVEKQKALINYARRKVREDIRRKALAFKSEQDKNSKVDFSARLYLEAKGLGAMHGGEYFWFKLTDEGGLEDKSVVAIDGEYTSRPKTKDLRNLPVEMHEDYVYYRRTITAFTKTAIECLNQRIQEIGSVKVLTEQDSLDTLEMGDRTVERMRKERFLALQKN